jgi:neutral ceramidase
MGERNSESRRSFIKKSAGATAALSFSSILSGYTYAFGDNKSIYAMEGTDGENLVMKSGFSERDITPEIGMEKPGNYGKSYHQSLHDPCKVRAVVLNDGINRVALVGIDALAIYRPVVEAARKEIQKRCGIPAEAVLISASHSHSSGPTAMVQPGEYDHANEFVKSLAYEKSSCADAKYLKHVENQVVEAVCQANESSVEASLGIGRGIEDKVAFNRRFHMRNGLTYTHPGQLNPNIVKSAGPIDPEVGVIGSWDKQGKCIGCVVNYACHATTNPGGISANWIYYMEQAIRGAMGPDCIVVFVTGASGDITQVNNLNPYVNRKGEEWARFVGGRVGAEVVKILLSMPRGALVPLDAKIQVMEMRRRVPGPERVKECYELVKKTPEEVGSTKWSFAKEIVMLDAKLEKEPTAQVEVQAVQVGPAVFVTNPAEFFCQLGLDIKMQSRFPFTFPVELANGCVGYVPTAEAFDKNGGGYETRLTSYSNLEIQAGNKMVNAGVNLTWQMKPGKVPEMQKAPAFNGRPWEYGSVRPEVN